MKGELIGMAFEDKSDLLSNMSPVLTAIFLGILKRTLRNCC
jgi:hypothetical protein